jgi:membrane protein involved in colicin uptake
MMEKEMRALKAEVTSLRSKLPRTEKVKVTTISFKDIKTEIEEEYPTKIVMESDPDEDSRIIEILKLLDEENATKKQKAEGMEKKREEEANFVASEKAKLVAAEKAVAEAEDFAIKAAAEAKKVLAAKKAADEKRRIDEATAAAAREAVEKMLEEETKSKKMTKGVETAQAKAETVKKTATRKAAAKSATSAAMKSDDGKSTTKKATVIDSDDWSTLSESTLKRKSVAQLNEYLTRKGAAVSHQDGKSMNKSELLEAVKSLKISV